MKDLNTILSLEKFAVMKAQANSCSYLPLVFFLSYIWGTFLISVYGPIKFVGYEPGIIAAYLVYFSIMAIVGFRFGLARGRWTSAQYGPEELPSDKIEKVWLPVAIKLFGIVTTMKFLLALSGGVNTSFSNAGATYMQSYEGYTRGAGSLSTAFIFDSFFWPISAIATIGGLAFFNKLPKSLRWTLAWAVAVNLFLTTVSSGKQKYLGDLMAITLGLSMIAYARASAVRRSKLLAYFLTTSLFGIWTCILLLTMRFEAIGINTFDINARVHPLVSIDLDHPLFDIFGPQLGIGIVAFSGYLCQGWYGFYLATQVEWFSTWGLGSSYTIQMLLKRFIGIEGIYESTLAYRVGNEFFWGESKWHSVFTHLASDFGFIGTGVIVFCVTLLWAQSWFMSISRYDVRGIFLFTWLTIGSLFVVANNQLFHSPGMFFTSIIFGYLFLCSNHSIKYSGAAKNREKYQAVISALSPTKTDS